MSKKNKTFIFLLVLVVAMFGFSFAMIPLYNAICKTLGLNGKTNITPIANTAMPVLGRKITVGFVSTTDNNLPILFYPNVASIQIKPGENVKTFYIAENNTNRVINMQAIPSISPGQAAQYFKKIDCFCFRKQILMPHQKIEMPVVFFIDPKIPKRIADITLSYTMYRKM